MYKNKYQEETEKIVKFIQDTFKEKGFDKAIVGVSGGLDSAVIVALLVKALGKDNIRGIYMPVETPEGYTDDAFVVSDKFKIKMDIYAIKRFIDMFKTTFPELDTEKIRFGNLMARTRMMILYDISSKYNALVVGTGNKTELTLGYFTLYGDGACALEPTGHLYKTEIKQLAVYLKVPEQIIKKAPSAELWEGQTDEEEIGINYIELDKFLYMKENNISIDTYEEWMHNIDKRIKKNKFKTELPRMLGE